MDDAEVKIITDALGAATERLRLRLPVSEDYARRRVGRHPDSPVAGRRVLISDGELDLRYLNRRTYAIPSTNPEAVMPKWVVTIRKPNRTILHTRMVEAEDEAEAFKLTAELVGGPRASEYVLKSARQVEP